MVLNPYLENRLADQRIHEALCVAKLDCQLPSHFKKAQKPGWSFPVGLFLLPLMVITLPFQMSILLFKRHWA